VVSRHETFTTSSSWSKAETSRRNGESRLGVRRRVKAVLAKAKSRTGQPNRNSDASVVAEAASLGGFSESSADFVQKNGSVSSSSSSSPRSSYDAIVQGRNGTDVQLALDVSSPVVNNNNNGASSPRAAAAPTTTKTTTATKASVEVDAVLNSGQVEPLPFALPTLTAQQEELLAQDERVQEQTKMGQEGSGFVVLEVPAPDYIVWECLLDFEKYPEYIDTVRSMTLFTNTHLKQSYSAEKPVQNGTGRETRHYGTASITRASFTLSRKFRLKIAAVHQYRPHPDGHYMEFSLDRANRNLVLQDAKGIWYTQPSPTREGYTRIWLLCELKVSRVLPKFIVDYAAVRAMPRASTWLRPTVLQMKREFELGSGGGSGADNDGRRM